MREVSCHFSTDASHSPLRQRQIGRIQSNRFLESINSTISSSNSSVVINLLQFVVSVNTIEQQEDKETGTLSSSYNNVTNALDELLTKELQMEFSSLISVDLQLSSLTFAARASATSQEQQMQQQQQLLTYSGTATFALESTGVTVYAQDVQDTAAVILQDIEAVTLVAPAVTSITVSNKVSNTQSPPSSSTSSTNYSGVLIALAIGSGLTCTIAIYLGYRYFKNNAHNKGGPTLGCSAPDSNPQPSCGGGSRRAMLRNIRYFQEPARTNQLTPPMEQVLSNSSTTSSRYQDGATDSVASAGQHQNYEFDDFSLDGISSINSETSNEVATNDTQIYLAKRRKEKRQQQKNQKKVKDLQKEEDGESDTDFSYDYIGMKQTGMESKDDDDDEIELPMSSRYSDVEHGGIEVGVNGNIVVAGGRIQTVNGGGRGVSTTNAAKQQSSTSHVIPRKSPKNGNIPSDASLLEGRPFDEAIRNVESLADPRNETAFGLVAKVNPTVVRNSRRNEEDEEALSSFLRGRQNANRVARALRDSTKK
jgi:hypothetical protein